MEVSISKNLKASFHLFFLRNIQKGQGNSMRQKKFQPISYISKKNPIATMSYLTPPKPTKLPQIMTLSKKSNI